MVTKVALQNGQKTEAISNLPTEDTRCGKTIASKYKTSATDHSYARLSYDTQAHCHLQIYMAPWMIHLEGNWCPHWNPVS